MQRHHGALAEADQHSLAFVEAVSCQGVVEKPVDQRRRLAHAGRGDQRIEARDAEPLVAGRIELAGMGRIGGVEHGVGHQRRQHRRQPDQVVAVGAVAVQQHHDVARSAAGVRAVARPLELRHSFLLQSGMLRR
jgi:hypothetical protein